MTKNPLAEDHALKEAIEAAERNSQDDRAQTALGNLYYDRGEFTQAIVYYQKARELRPDEGIHESNIAEAYRALKDWDEAIKHYKAALGRNPKDHGVLNRLGVAYYSKGDREQAVEFYLKAVQIKPEPVYYVNLADAYRETENLQEAEDYYQNAAAMDDAYAPAHNGLGIVFALKGRTEEAVERFERAVALDSTEPVYYVNLGDACRTLNLWEKAIEAYNNAIKIDPNDARTLNAIGVAYSQLKVYDKAIEYYQLSLSLEETALIQSNLGSAYRSIGDLDNAIVRFRRAIELDPHDDITYNNLGILYYRKGKHLQAIQLYTKAAEIRRDPIFPINIADSYRELGKLDKAIEYYQAGVDLAIETGADATTFKRELGLVYNESGIDEFMAGNQEKAIELYRKALDLLVNDGAVYHNMYLSLKILKRYPEAEINLRKAIELDPKGKDFQVELQELQQLLAPSQPDSTRSAATS